VCYVRTMATIKEAFQNAITFAKETLGAERTAGLQLEEVESASLNGEEAWLITLSMISSPRGVIDAVNSAWNALGEPKRDYKTFTVLKKNGDVTSMKVRELAAT
jgi:hypothetical protein